LPSCRVVLTQLRVIYGPLQVYESCCRLEIGDKPFGDVRVGVSTLFLGPSDHPGFATAALTLSFAIINLQPLSPPVCSPIGLLRPLETIFQKASTLLARGPVFRTCASQAERRMGRGFPQKLNLLGEQMRGEKAALCPIEGETLASFFSKLSDGLLLFLRGKTGWSWPHPPAARLLGCRAEVIPASPGAGGVLRRQTLSHDLLREAFASRAIKRSGEPFDKAAKPPGAPCRECPISSVNRGEAMGCLVTLRDASTTRSDRGSN